MELAELASRQHGVVAQAQLVALGFDRQAIAYRLKVGRLHLLHRGVYAVGRTARLTPDRGATRSYLEDDFVRFFKRHRLPLPEFNQTIAGHEVDAVYRQQKLVIELGSRQFHTTTQAFEQDRDRDADILNAGFSTLRITDHRLKRHPTNEAQRLNEILRSRSAS